jgi:hypothetical protein
MAVGGARFSVGALEASGALGSGDAAEPFENIMAQLQRSRHCDALVDSSGSSTPSSPHNRTMILAERPCPQHSSAERPRFTSQMVAAQYVPCGPAPHVQPLRAAKSSATIIHPAMHPRPFGPQKATGSFFSAVGNLKQRDLTSWEQQKTIMPERSWSTSATTCVLTGGWQQQLPREAQHPQRLAVNEAVPKHMSKTCSSLPGCLRSNERLQADITMKLSPGTMPECEEVLTPVRTKKGGRGSPWPQRGAIDRAHSLPATPPNQQQQDPAVLQGDIQLLLERRRQLAAEFRRTDQLAREALRESKAIFVNCENTTSLVSPGGGGGAPTRIYRQPSAGGPFAGPRSTMERSTAAAAMKKSNTAAAVSYSYLGPGSDGPPGPQIHPLWN